MAAAADGATRRRTTIRIRTPMPAAAVLIAPCERLLLGHVEERVGVDGWLPLRLSVLLLVDAPHAQKCVPDVFVRVAVSCVYVRVYDGCDLVDVEEHLLAQTLRGVREAANVAEAEDGE